MANPRPANRLREAGTPATLRGMLGDVKRTYRRVAAALALLGVALYALLLPWHLTSQFALGLYEAEFGPVASVICGKGADSTNPGLPGAPATSCPICKGLAAFQLTLASSPTVLALPALGEAQFAAAAPEDVAGAAPTAPRNRGPPLNS
jgi:hypothetical protein